MSDWCLIVESSPKPVKRRHHCLSDIYRQWLITEHPRRKSGTGSTPRRKKR